jgi:DNA polymerase I-like protein with 3'-5' exonuclease and polymerase domains
MAYELVRSAERLGHIANEIVNSPAMGLDIETTGFKPDVPESSPSPFRDDIRLLSINTGQGVYVIDLYETKTLGPVVPALAESKGIKIIQNAKYEQKWLLYKHDLELWPIFDPYRASVLIHNGRDLSHDLYSLYERELKMAPPTRDLGASDWSLPLTKDHYDYAASDVSYLHQLRDSLKPKLAAKGLNKTALIEFGVILPEAAVELNGFPLDKDSWTALAVENEKKATELHKQLIWELPNPKQQLTLLGFEPDINLDSPPQMLASLRKLGIQQQCEECRGRGRTRQGDGCNTCLGAGILPLQNTREMTLAMFAADYPVIKKLLGYRDYSKKLASFGPEYLRHINPLTGRIHGEYFPFTGAGRYAMSKPNLQQIPRDKEFRKCFKAPPGCRFVLADYSNIEMRLVAEISGDRVLIEIFQRGEDAHYATAALLVGVPREKAKELVTKLQRQQAKPVNFGFIYGMQAPKLVLYAQANYGVSLTLKQAEQFRERFFAPGAYSRIAEWHQEVLEEGARTHMARTLAGRLRYLADDAHNEFFNTPVQGSGADALKAALRAVYFRLKKFGPWNGPVKMCHHVHDEIITQTPDEEELIGLVKIELEAGMQEGVAPFMRRVPVVVEPDSGYSWADKG